MGLDFFSFGLAMICFWLTVNLVLAACLMTVTLKERRKRGRKEAADQTTANVVSTIKRRQPAEGWGVYHVDLGPNGIYSGQPSQN